MKGQGGYVPPQYIPLGQPDIEQVGDQRNTEETSQQCAAHHSSEWSSGICACFDDMPSCCVGLFCPCFLFGKNAESLGAGTLAGSCMTHVILWGVINGLCCLFTEGALLGIPGTVVACYACGYRKTLRSEYNLQEAPCGDLTTHIFCHPCAICQEYREIRERSGSSGSDLQLPAVSAPPVQMMTPDLNVEK